MLQWTRLQDKFCVTKHDDNKVHCLFNGINYTKTIVVKSVKNIFAIYKNIDAFYEKY
jgi:hypothetical protein